MNKKKIKHYTVDLFMFLLSKTIPKCRACKYFIDPGMFAWDGSCLCCMCGASDKQPFGVVKKFWMIITNEKSRWGWKKL